MQAIIAAVVGLSIFHLVLGAVSVCLGVVSSIQAEVWLAHSVSPIWSGGFFILTGILGFACAKKKSAYLILCFTAFSVVSLVTAVVSIQLLRLGLINHTNDGNTFQKEKKDFLIIVALATAGTECLICIISSFVSCRVARAAKKELFKKREGTFSVQDICVNEDQFMSNADMGELNPAMEGNGILERECQPSECGNMWTTYFGQVTPTMIDVQGKDSHPSHLKIDTPHTLSDVRLQPPSGLPDKPGDRIVSEELRNHGGSIRGNENTMNTSLCGDEKEASNSVSKYRHDMGSIGMENDNTRTALANSVEASAESLEDVLFSLSEDKSIVSPSPSPDIVINGADGKTQIKVSFTEMSLQSGYIAQSRRQRSFQTNFHKRKHEVKDEKRKPTSLKDINKIKDENHCAVNDNHISGERKKRKLPVVSTPNGESALASSEASSTTAKKRSSAEVNIAEDQSTEHMTSNFAQINQPKTYKNADSKRQTIPASDLSVSKRNSRYIFTQVQDEGEYPKPKSNINRLSGSKSSHGAKERRSTQSTETKVASRHMGMISIPNPSIKKHRRHSLHTALDPIVENPADMNEPSMPSIRSSPNLTEAITDISVNVPPTAWSDIPDVNKEQNVSPGDAKNRLIDRPGRSPRVFSQEFSCVVHEPPYVEDNGAHSQNYVTSWH
ncbi:uncharacterized protein LOC106164882 [Lingula anatina]|uniref:Transmembrane protein 196 n=1 Tax=Lingula anatina TaxID=7574 RepID=A0A1S3IJU1_LINAN|nr:uncharacterized protein LOC106164882 [Lingula anatina]|eukprot:XP_013398378.1 uncharacterized protein LOC106164882 [Lingula anatina]